MRDDLLRPQRERRRVGGGQRKRLVERVRVQRVGPAEDGGQRLQRRAHDIVIGLLRGERDARRLAVEAQLPRRFAPRPEAMAHRFRPDLAGCAVLGDLLEEIAVRVEEEGNARDEVVHVEPGVDSPPHVLDAIA